LIQPDVELFVAVTVHDLKGNVHLTDLTQATVTPIDNINDNTSPDRLTDLELTDRPNDDGSALLLGFELSNADDIAYYDVYATTFEFNAANPNGQALTPIASLDRNPSLPLTIDIVAGDTPVIPGQDIWVAVVAVDTSGNAHTTDLTVVKAQSIDDGVTDPGNYLPDIESVTATWDMETNIFVEWDHSTDAQVRGYHVYISDSAFEDITDATMVGDVKASNSFLITPSLFEELDNESAWYVAVTPYDESLSKETVTSVKLNAFGDDGKAPVDGDDSGQLSLESLLTGPNLIAAGMLVIVVLLAVLVVRSRGSSNRRSKSWELQEATWGIQDQGWGDAPGQAPPASPPPAPPQGVSQQQATDIYAAANQIQSTNYGRTEYQPAQPVLQPQVRADVVNDLLGTQTPPPSPQIDTSFLDDLL
jgi:type II secretory pathway pseudopilin PulG